tara:strand:+ start:1032 stop:1586 length:555 start_codon:yes stop_codon:yes gene_type:complete
MIHKLFKIYHFIDKFKENELINLNKNIIIILRNYKKEISKENILKIRDFLKKKGNKFYLANNVKLAHKLALDGAYIPSFNRSNLHNCCKFRKNFKIIGSAHNIYEIRTKEKQNCEEIFISPLFETKYYNSFLGIHKFTNLASITKRSVIALGGINNNNFKKINRKFISGFASISWLKKNGLNKI